MKIALLAPSDRTFIKDFLPEINENNLPIGYAGAPFIGTLIYEFLKLGHEVVVVTTSNALNGDYSIKEFSSDRFSWNVVPARPNPIKNNGRKMGRILDGFAHEQKEMIKVLEKSQPDFVHAHWSYEFAGAAIKSNFPYLITVHDNPYVILKYFKNFYRFGRLLMAESNLKKISFATTVSPYMLPYVEKRCNNVKIIPNPIQINYTKKDIEQLVETKLKDMVSPRIFMVNNGWDERKNGKTALLAFQMLLEYIPNATLHLYGGGSQMEGPAYKDVKALGVKNVYFNGTVTRPVLLEALKTANLFLHPALEESFGVVLIEAMSMGIPCIGGKTSGAVPWVIDNPKLLVNVNKPNSIKEKMLELLTQKEMYQTLAIKGYDNVVNRFSSNSVADAYIKYYYKILKKC